MKVEARARAAPARSGHAGVRVGVRALLTGIMAAAILSGCAVAMLGGAARSGSGASAPGSAAGKSAPQPASDSSISTTVRSRLSANSTLKTLKIGVDTHDGIVTLTGQVNTLAAKSAAQAEARAVGGVKGVNNQLTVR